MIITNCIAKAGPYKIPLVIHQYWLWKTIQPFTLVGKARAQSIYNLARKAIAENIPGDFVECGVCNGGTAAIMAHFAAHSNPKRTTWLFDSFEGMPQTTIEDGEKANEYVGKDVGSIDLVNNVLQSVRADNQKVHIIKGWFDETLNNTSISTISLLNIDADWYESVKLCLETFYDRVSEGGYISIDDYGHWPGCKKAVDEFFSKRDIHYKLNSPDYTARWFQKK